MAFDEAGSRKYAFSFRETHDKPLLDCEEIDPEELEQHLELIFDHLESEGLEPEQAFAPDQPTDPESDDNSINNPSSDQMYTSSSNKNETLQETMEICSESPKLKN